MTKNWDGHEPLWHGARESRYLCLLSIHSSLSMLSLILPLTSGMSRSMATRSRRKPCSIATNSRIQSRWLAPGAKA